jgi:hypothetical protein
MGSALDYYPVWAGGREVVLYQGNPYEPEITLSIQEAIYGRPALPTENQHGYAYPAYVSLVVFPFMLLPFPLSASVWIACQQFLLIGAVILTIQATGWQLGRWSMLLVALAAMTFRYSMITMVLGQTSTWVLFWLALALWAALGQRGFLSGLCLVVAAIKPQLVILPALALLTSLPSPQRKRVAIAGGAGLVILVLSSFLLAGSWVGDYWQQLQAYQTYSTTQPPISELSGIWLPESASRWLHVLLTSVLLGFLAAVLWHWRGSGQASLPVAVTVTVTQLVMPQTGSYNLVLLLLPAVVALSILSTIHGPQNWLVSVGKLLVWADLLLIPWFLWATFQGTEMGPWDLVLVPGILLAVMIVLVLRPGTAPV